MNYQLKCVSTALLLAVFSLTLAACSRDKDKEKSEKQDISTSKPGKVTKPRMPPQPPAEVLPVSGKVLEILDTGSFLFVSLDWRGKKVWATVPGVDLKVGEVISLYHATMIKRFHSKVLNRTFDELIFASSVAGKPPRARVAKKGNPNDPSNRRSGQFTAGAAQSVPPAPVPAKPVAKPADKVGN